jgi:hypothetical protein
MVQEHFTQETGVRALNLLDEHGSFAVSTERDLSYTLPWEFRLHHDDISPLAQFFQLQGDIWEIALHNRVNILELMFNFAILLF